MSSRRSRNRKRNRSKVTLKQQKAFWGDTERMPDLDDAVSIASDPTAVVASLGRVPLPGSETISEHYFQAVLERSVMLGSALAAAGGLIEADDLADHG